MSIEIDLGNGYIGHLIMSDCHPSGYGAVSIHHPKPDGGTCGHIATWDGSQPADRTWDLISLSPLTLSPSLLCRICGDHGFVQGGKWVPT